MVYLPELVVKWWRWFLSDGEQDDCIFLDSRVAQPNDKQIYKTFTQVNNKPILVNVDKWISIGFSFTPDSELIELAKRRIDMLVYKDVIVDGERMQSTRVLSPVFNIDIKREIKDPEIGPKVRKGKYKVVSDGFWLYLDSLSKGTHIIETMCSCKSGQITLSMNHTINVI